MVAPTPIKVGMPVDEFIRLFEQDGPFELIDGERTRMTPNVFGHIRATNRLFALLFAFVSPRHLGEVFSEGTFTLTDPTDPNWVKGSRIPDIMFIRAERLAAYEQTTPNARDLPLALVPDLVVEIVSPTDLYSKVNIKVQKYLADGVKLVWVVDLMRESVVVHETGSNAATTLTKDQMLTGGSVMEGFEIKIASIFE